MNIATHNHDGSIHLVAMWYGFTPDGPAGFETFAKSQKIQNLRRDPRITALVEAGEVYEELRGVELVGTAEVTEDPDVLMPIARSVVERYMREHQPEDLDAVAEMMARNRAAIVLERRADGHLGPQQVGRHLLSGRHRRVRQQRRHGLGLPGHARRAAAACRSSSSRSGGASSPTSQDVCDRFAAEGFAALAPDLYRGETTTEPDEAGKLMMALNIEQAAKDMCGAVEKLPAGHAAARPSASPASAWAAGSPSCSPATGPTPSPPACRSTGSSPGRAAQPDWSTLQRRGARPLRRAGRLLRPRAGRGARAGPHRRRRRRRRSTCTPASTTPSSTTPGPRSTTPPSRRRRGTRPWRSSVPSSERSGAAGPAEVSDVLGRYLDARPPARPPRRRPRRRLLRPAGARATGSAAEPARRPGGHRRRRPAALADLDAGAPIDEQAPGVDEPHRRRWLRAQVLGLHTTAEKLAGVDISFPDEVERCYGVRPAQGRRVGLRGGPPRPRRGPARLGAAGRALHRLAGGAGRARREAARRPSTRSPRTSASAPTGSSACPRASTSTSTSSPTSRGRASTTTSATCAAGS